MPEVAKRLCRRLCCSICDVFSEKCDCKSRQIQLPRGLGTRSVQGDQYPSISYHVNSSSPIISPSTHPRQQPRCQRLHAFKTANQYHRHMQLDDKHSMKSLKHVGYTYVVKCGALYYRPSPRSYGAYQSLGHVKFLGSHCRSGTASSSIWTNKELLEFHLTCLYLSLAENHAG